MAYTAIHRYAKISPRKVRPLADLIRGSLPTTRWRSCVSAASRARLLEKVPAKRPGQCRGPAGRRPARLDGRRSSSRWRADVQAHAAEVAGNGSIIKKRMSHIRVELE